MKNFTIGIFLLFLSQIKAQITITNAYFPENGDSLVTANAILAHVNFTRITPAGNTAQTWDFSYLRSAQNNAARTVQRFRAVNAATDTAILRNFPTANLIEADTSGNAQVYRRTATRFDLLGFYGQSIPNLPLSIAPVFEPASLERRATLTFNSTNRNQTGFNVGIPISAFPDSIRSQLPIPTDSMRIRFQTTRTDKVDAFGKISIGGLQNVDCLRERRYEISETKIELRIPNTIFWFDITAFVFANATRPAKDTTIEYNFWTNQFKEPLVSIRTDNDLTANSVSFKWLPLRTSVENTEGGHFGLKIFPSPTAATLFVEIERADDQPIAQIFDALGRVQLSQKLTQTTTPIDVSAWQNGIYFLKLGAKTQAFVVKK